MKFYKLQYIKKEKTGTYLLYALGEILFIIIGILSALFINNWYAEKAYHQQIDNNIIRVYEEMEGNINACREAIIEYRMKDSLIYKVIMDSVEGSDYRNNQKLSYLILSYINTNIEEKAFQNLIEINNSENCYQEQLINEIKDLYEITDDLERDNKTMHEYVYNDVMTSLIENTSSFGKLSFTQDANEEMIDFFLSSDLYKSLVSKYSIIGIRNQLRLNQLYYKRAISLYFEIAKQYGLENIYNENNEIGLDIFKGQYVGIKSQDIFDIEVIRDSLYLKVDTDYKIKLITIAENQYFMDLDMGGYFVTFYNDRNNEIQYMSINYLADREIFRKASKVEKL